MIIRHVTAKHIAGKMGISFCSVHAAMETTLGWAISLNVLLPRSKLATQEIKKILDKCQHQTVIFHLVLIFFIFFIRIKISCFCPLTDYRCHVSPCISILSANENTADNQCLWFQISNIHLSYDVTSWSEITPCNKICKPLVVYRFSGNVMTAITTLRT